MADRSAIEWTDATWNPVTGCTKVSPGCAYCYAERLMLRFGGKPFLPGKAEIVLHPERLDAPLRWRKPRRVFVNSMSDLFHEEVPDEFIDQVFARMRAARWHVFQILTKRPERMRAYVGPREGSTSSKHWYSANNWRWPLPNVWLGVSVENQRWADERIPLLLDTPAAIRFVSCEPLLAPLDIARWLRVRTDYHAAVLGGASYYGSYDRRHLDWVICGGESSGPEGRRLVERCMKHQSCRAGYPKTAGEVCGECDAVGPARWRPTAEALAWVRSLRDQCVAARVPFLMKGWGGPRSTSGGRLLDGKIWHQFPDGGAGGGAACPTKR